MQGTARIVALATVWLAAASLTGKIESAEPSSEPSPEQLEFFEAQVRPILVERCYECHSGKTEEPKGGLRVDSQAALFAGGETGPALLPGKPKESLLIDAINYGDLYQMPPKSKMPEAEIAVLTKWVADGAYWPKGTDSAAGGGSLTAKSFDLQQRKAEHWCWQPIVDPPLPTVNNAQWCRQDLDRFILARLEKEGISPAPPADRRTLVRRAYFDVIGLPPSPEQIAEALADESPQWFEHVVDKLLESPHFGERWGRHWLDLVRYAESRGHEFDYNVPNAHQYRDYVIRALNADVPYDQFVTEHLAGDLLKNPRTNPSEGFNESILGTGFWFLGEWVHSPVDIRKDETDRFDNMVDVFGKTFLGVTISCARCHDHKFDAISQKDYYALFGFLQSSGYRLARFDTMQRDRQIAQQAEDLKKEHLPGIAGAVTKSKQKIAAQVSRYLLACQELTKAGIVVKPGEGGMIDAGAMTDETRAKIRAVAESKELNEATLTRWLGEVQRAKSLKTHPLHAWAVVCHGPAEPDGAKLRQLLTQEYPVPEKSAADTSSRTIVDYGRLAAEDWIADGVGFGLGPVKVGDLVVDVSSEPTSISVAVEGSAMRDPFWKGLSVQDGSEREGGKFNQVLRPGQTIRTPTFELTNGKVHALVDGHGFIYAAVDSHILIEGPLHGHLVRDTGQGALAAQRWISLDLSDYKGHRVHFEFTPQGESDFRVHRVVEGDRPPTDGPAALPDYLDVAAADSLSAERLAESYQNAMESSLRLLAEGQLTAEENASRYAALANWIVQSPRLFEPDAGETPEATKDAAKLLAAYRDQWRQLRQSIRPASRLAMAMWDGSGEDETLLIRGNHKTVGPVVPRRMLEAIDTGPMQLGRGSGRLELARAVIDSRNPLTARVMVNRIWHHLFGRGIVPSTDNFGVLGQEPTHPELLDYLATRFRQDGWSVKRTIRTILLSSAYQQDSVVDDAASESEVRKQLAAASHARDPQNLLFHRQNIKRLEGEAIRDAILAVSGRLDRTLHGPSVPVHLTPFMQGRGRPGTSGPLDGNGRRSIYVSVRRNFLSPMMLAFDTPIPFNTVGKRNVSNVPAQALILMNDPMVIEQSRVWAKQLLAEKNLTPEARIGRMYEQAFARPATEAEISDGLQFLAAQGRELGIPPDQAPSDERTWADLCHVLYNVKEFVFVR